MSFVLAPASPQAVGIEGVEVYVGGNLLEDVDLTTVEWTWAANDTFGDVNESYTSWSYTMIKNSESYNGYSYQTASETFSINVAATTPTANLIYNGTSHTGTRTGAGPSYVFNTTFDIPATADTTANQTFYWNVTTGGTTYLTGTEQQNVSHTNFSICAGGNVPFLNYSFIDETAGTRMNASNDLSDATNWLGSGTQTKSFTFTNTTNNYQYTFCASPNKTLTTDFSFKYSKTGYPQRTFVFDDKSLTNVTTQQTLYLLASADGIYSSISVIDTASDPIQGVLVQIEREIGGIWTLLTQGNTGTDGLVTFWVNPNYVHRITISKTGYITTQASITPTQTLYTMTLPSTSDTASYNTTITGIRAFAQPRTGRIINGTHNFNATITSVASNLENCRVEIMSSNSSILVNGNSAATNTSYCFANVNYNINDTEMIFMRISVDTTESDGYVYLTSDLKWFGYLYQEGIVKQWRTIDYFFTDLKDLEEFGTGQEAEFNRLIFFFFLTTLFVGMFIFFTGIEMSSPGWVLVFFVFVMLVASYGGFLSVDINDDGVNTLFEQFVLFGISFLWVGWQTINIIRRDMK